MSNLILGLFKNKKKHSKLSNIEQLRKKFVDLGYPTDEVNYLIRMYAHNQDLNKLDDKAIKQIEEDLNDHLNIAQKCLTVVKNN
jgi:hypothetical protein